MTNQPTDTREALKEKAWNDLAINDWRLNIRSVKHQREMVRFLNGMFDAGFCDGAASVDRVQIVREAFNHAKQFKYWTATEYGSLCEAMDLILAAMEKGK